MLVSHLIDATITGTFLLNNVMERMKMPTQEFSQNDLVAFEVPPLVETQSFEHKFMPIINHIHSSGPHIAVLVQQCLRPKRQRPLWMHRWNAMDSKPFTFQKVSSCKLGDAVPGCHFECYIGTTLNMTAESCTSIATPTASPETVRHALGGFVNAVVSELA